MIASRMRPGRRPAGVALFIVLILLLVMTLLVLASMRSTLLNERMSGATYDRSLAFQLTESALREAEALIEASANPVFGYNCITADATASPCAVTPSNAFQSGPTTCAVGQFECWVNSATAQAAVNAGRPQYYIEYLGSFDSEDVLGVSSSANQAQYGGAGGSPVAYRYRVSARSHNPTTAVGRSVVVLQTTVVRR